MSYNRFPKVVASALLASTLLSVTAFAAPADNATTAVRVHKGTNTIASSACGSQSPVAVSPSQAQGSFTVIYQDETGAESSATVTAMDAEQPVYGYVSAQGDGLRVRQGPGTNYAILATVRDGSTFPITGKTNGWYQIAYNGRTAYVSADYLVQGAAGDTNPAPVPPGKNENEDNVNIGTIQPPESFDGALAQRIVDYALQFEGYPYVWATTGPNSFDCSGLTYYVYKQFGYTLHRSSRDLIHDGVHVSKAELQPADLVLFSKNGSVVSHVGIYIGNGKFIHASTAKTGVIISDLSTNYYVNCYFDARRII